MSAMIGDTSMMVMRDQKTAYSVQNTINTKSKIDLFSDIMPYYMFRALRVDEGKYVVDQGMISFDLHKSARTLSLSSGTVTIPTLGSIVQKG